MSTFNVYCQVTNKLLNEHAAKLAEHDEDIRLLKEMGQPSGGEDGSGLLDALKKMIKDTEADLKIQINNVNHDLSLEIDNL